MAIYTLRTPDHAGLSKVEITSQAGTESTQKPGASFTPRPGLLNRFTERVHKCTESIRNSINNAGTAILKALGTLASGFGAAAFIVMSWLKSCAGSQENFGAGGAGYRITVDLDDHVTAWIETANDDDSDSAPQPETTINLNPVRSIDPVADFDNLINEINGTD